MPKRVFWPAALVVMGFLFLGVNIGLLPRDFWNLWPLLLIIVGLGGLLISDREEWTLEEQKANRAKAKAAAKPASKSAAKSSKKKTSAKKKTARSSKK
ncbi:MAG: DUF5668 domain-containing protein [Patescibacteria group bacterium]